MFSCESDTDFLSETPKTFYTLDNAFTSSSQVDQVLLSCYSQIRALMVSSSGNARILKGTGSDILDVPARRVATSFSDYNSLSALDSRYNAIYSAFYQLISKANTALYVADIEEIKWSSEESKKFAIAQAKFFRAYAYRNLGELFGGVPIVEEIIFSAKYDFVRTTRIETYQFAIDDLESVINDFPETTTQGGRIVKGAAQHYLSELYLAMGIEMEAQGQNAQSAYDKSIQYASQVIDGGTYALKTERFGTRMNDENGITGGADVFWDLFQVGNVNYQDGNTECIWAYQVDFEAYSAEDNMSTLNYPRDYMPALRVRDGLIGTDADVGGRGVAFSVPTMYMINEIWEGAVGEGDIRNAEHNIQRTFYYNDPT
ncbi:RagB/SusD family nutrient uptake outer membrane protein, partial [bacterium]|nr:RagB/SusD family nutrient uptake outer membrane protein [bacterium]